MAGKALRIAPGGSDDALRQRASEPKATDGMIERLAAEIARIERRAPGPAEATAVRRIRIGLPEIDAALGSADAPGLPVAALHEVRAAHGLDAGPASGFAFALGCLLADGDGPLFWVAGPGTRAEGGRFHGPGLAAFGLDPARLVRVHADGCRDALWAAGEIAATPGVALCLLELRANPAAADLTFSRRLAMRAAGCGVPVILLRQGGEEEASAASTRWLVSAVPSLAGQESAARKWLGPPAWHVSLEKCRTGRNGNWMLEWNREQHRLVPLMPDAGSRAAGRAGGRPALSGAGPALSADRPYRAVAMGR